MPELLLIQILLPLAAAIICSFLLELMLQPRPLPLWNRTIAALALHKGIVTLLFTLELLLFRRPWFAAANVLALLLFLALVNNAKFQALREPFICQDFEYFSDALKHPRLYLPFLGIGRALAAVTGISGAIIAGMLLEAAIPSALLLLAVTVLGILGAFSLWLGNLTAPAISCHPTEDLNRLGQLTSLWLYGRTERTERPERLPGCPAFRSTEPVDHGRELPDLIAVQSESFFDPRRSYPLIRPEVLEQFDRLKASSLHGRLKVPAWGANTVRTEFAFLSGLEAARLGIHQFNPYRWFARQSVATLARFLRKQGYHTVCIHPYPAGFYNREAVYPNLGFDEFMDIREFSDGDRSGPYTGDCAVARKVHERLNARRQRKGDGPLFIFVITMENHGPLHLERVAAGEVEHYYHQTPPAGCDDLTIYLRHLANADRMLGMLRDTLKDSKREGLLCFFGDHPPIMADVYRALGEPDGSCDYLIWSNRGGTEAAGAETDLDVWNLGEVLLRQAGLVKS